MGFFHRAFFAAVLAASVTGLAGCVGSFSGSQGCATLSDCDSGYACDQGECVLLCSSNSECTTLGAVWTCREGRCQEGTGPECSSDADCTTPGRCEQTPGTCQNAVCSYPDAPLGTNCEDDNPCTTGDSCNGSGVCLGSPVTCTTPPANECINGDTVFQVYEAVGQCDPLSGNCEYPSTGTSCPNCANDCLAACAALTCTPSGPCETAGCDPGPPAVCTFGPVLDGAICDVGAGAWVCQAGNCVECISDADCSPPGLVECFSMACVANQCQATVLDTVSCAPSSCTNGVTTNARVCGTAGDCPDAGTTDCGGYVCNSNGSACLTSCTTSADCVGTLTCTGNNCQGLGGTGASCASNGECSEVCIVGTCGPRSGLSGACDETADCASGLSCTGGICLGATGTACASNSECAQVCIAGTCAPRSSTGGPCDQNSDCSSGGLCSAGTCKKPLGSGCSVGSECINGFCADGVCCSSACNGPCENCGADGLCDDMPADDSACGTITCSSLSTTCRTYSNLTTNRCASLGSCKRVRTSDCTDFSNAGTGVECAQSTGPCDAAEFCNGSGSCSPNVPGALDGQNCGGCGTCSGGSCNPNQSRCGGAGSCAVCGTASLVCEAGTGNCGDCGSCQGDGAGGFSCVQSGGGLRCGTCGQCSQSGTIFLCGPGPGCSLPCTCTELSPSLWECWSPTVFCDL